MEVSRDDCSKLIWGEVKLGLDPADLTLLDLGAGTGLVGGLVRKLGVLSTTNY
jgi:predicted TPR repeat methyltransferase